MEQNSLMLNEFVSRIFAFYMTNKINHWSTDSYATHVNTDNFNSKLLEITDKITEIAIRVYGVKPKIERIKPYNQYIGNNVGNNIVELYELFKNYVMKEKLLQHPELVNLRDELLNAINQAQYLLVMK